MKVLLTGATGLIGRELGKALVRAGHHVVIISRDAERARRICPFPCDIVEGDLSQAPVSSHFFDQLGGVIHLMGDSVASGRWTEAKKKAIVESRVQSTRNLRASVENHARVLVAASGTGYYGDRGEEELREDSAPGQDFLAEVCVAWEKEAKAFEQDGVRVVSLRTGIVLSNKGGALMEMLTPYRAGVAGPVGDGRQWMSWIHVDDIVGLYLHALESEGMSGVLDAVAPEPQRNHDFVACLGETLHRPAVVPTPAWGLHVLLGEKADLLTGSQKVSSTLARRSGYVFKFPELRAAMRELLEPYGRGEELFQAEQYVPLPPEKVFPFFAEAKNLGRITPPLLDFRIDGVSTPMCGEGTIIDYTLKVHGVPLHWKTRIEEWNPPSRFVDHQLKGPYKLWHHTHSFEPLGGGTLLSDRVRYRLPLGFIGWLGGAAFVRGDVEKIFGYRRKVIDQMFGAPTHGARESSEKAMQ